MPYTTSLDRWAADRNVELTPDEVAVLLNEGSAICQTASDRGPEFYRLLFIGRRVELDKARQLGRILVLDADTASPRVVDLRPSYDFPQRTR